MLLCLLSQLSYFVSFLKTSTIILRDITDMIKWIITCQRWTNCLSVTNINDLAFIEMQVTRNGDVNLTCTQFIFFCPFACHLSLWNLNLHIQSLKLFILSTYTWRLNSISLWRSFIFRLSQTAQSRPTKIHRDLLGKYYLLDFFHHCKAVRKHNLQ